MSRTTTGCYLSTSCFSRNYVAEAIERCHEFAPYRVEISAPHLYQPIDELEILLREYRERGFALTIHNYFPSPLVPFVLNIAASNGLGKKRAKSLIEEALRLALAAGSPFYGVHAGYLARADATDTGMFNFDSEMSSYSSALDRAVSFVNQIAPSFEKKGVGLIIENLFPSPNKRHSLFCSFEEIKEYMDQVPSNVGLLLDLGHLNVSSNIFSFNREVFLERFLDSYSERLFQVHLSENSGFKDEHRAVLIGSWQLEALSRIHRQSCARGVSRTYCLEARNSSEEDIRASLDHIDEIVS
jgi:sugar phosphate isomerase/epimerase